MRKKQILIHSLVFSPDGVSTAYLYNDLALGFKEAGYDVLVLTTTPHYNLLSSSLEKQILHKKIFGLYYTSNFNEIRVIHVPLKKYKNSFIRIISFIHWHIFSLIIGVTIKNIDFVLSPSPPLSIGVISILIAKIKRAKFVYNVQEIYPDLLIKNGGLKSNILIKLLRKLEKFVYNNSSAVIAIDQIFYNQIINRFYDKSKLKIISNFVDTEIYKPLDLNIQPIAPFIKQIDKVILLYAGNIGVYQDWEPILYAANALKFKNIEFWIIGEGVKKDYLKSELENRRLNNIILLPYQNREQMSLINSFADIHFISINKEMEQEGFPSKVYTIMACAKPLIVITGKNTPLYNFLEKLNCSILISENRNENFVNSIIDLEGNLEKQIELGRNGYKEVLKNYTKKSVVKKYLELFESL